jgi:hypothetical protein
MNRCDAKDIICQARIYSSTGQFVLNSEQLDFSCHKLVALIQIQQVAGGQGGDNISDWGGFPVGWLTISRFLFLLKAGKMIFMQSPSVVSCHYSKHVR